MLSQSSSLNGWRRAGAARAVVARAVVVARAGARPWAGVVASFTVACAGVLGANAWAQTVVPGAPSASVGVAAPSTEQMIEQLQKPKTSATRSLTRNLQVEATRPSLSLMVQFDFDSARIRPESQLALGNLAEALKSSALLDAKFAVEGHTDAKGSADYNRKLSLARAESVQAFLAARDVQGQRLVASGKGSSEPANKADPMAPENRRVRIVNLEP